MLDRPRFGHVCWEDERMPGTTSTLWKKRDNSLVRLFCAPDAVPVVGRYGRSQ